VGSGGVLIDEGLIAEERSPRWLELESDYMDARPIPLNTTVRSQMQRMPTKDSKPELLLRRELFRRGMRFRVNYRVSKTRPDIVFTRAKIAIFVDGCFWHRCPEHGTLPKNNADWWLAKLDGNVDRDLRNTHDLEEQGWTVLRFWEHESPLEAADRVEGEWAIKRAGK
jgi:DNA mismatch endonuclease, patch repair protein